MCLRHLWKLCVSDTCEKCVPQTLMKIVCLRHLWKLRVSETWENFLRHLWKLYQTPVKIVSQTLVKMICLRHLWKLSLRYLWKFCVSDTCENCLRYCENYLSQTLVKVVCLRHCENSVSDTCKILERCVICELWKVRKVSVVAGINYCPCLCLQKLMNITDKCTMSETQTRVEIWSPEFHNINPRYRDVLWVTVICNYVLGVASIKPGMKGNRFNERLIPISQISVVLHPHDIKYGRISIILGGRDDIASNYRKVQTTWTTTMEKYFLLRLIISELQYVFKIVQWHATQRKC